MIRPAMIIAGLLLFAPVGCQSDAEERPRVNLERPIREVTAEFDQRLLIPTSVLTFRLRNTDRLMAESVALTFSGEHSELGSWDKQYSGLLGRMGDVGDIVVKLPVSGPVWADMMGRGAGEDAGASFDGSIELELRDALGVAVRAQVSDLHLEFVGKLAPVAAEITIDEVFPGQQIAVEGSGFLRPDEGETRVIIDSGEVEYADGARRDISGKQIALRWAGSREHAYFPVDPAVFGVQVATFLLHFHLENHLDDSTIWAGSTAFDALGSLQTPYLANLSPQEGSRGQKITLIGRGFVSTDATAGYGMLLRYEGKFIPDDPALPSVEYRGQTPLLRAPDRIMSEQKAEQNVWYEIEEDRTLSGLGAHPGVFRGSITPELFDRHGEQTGIGWEGEFRVLPTKQLVYLKFLPSFSTGLDKYGLRNVELEIRRRIVEVTERDYQGINVDFRTTPPDDYIDFAVVELGGPDPSGYQSFGYDNSFNGVAKDTGNLYLADYLGGLNAQSGQEFNNPYGGIFLESFSFFSAELNPDNLHASAEFDRIMRPFMPALGGTPVRGTEWPDGPRHNEIALAIRMVGSVLGNTVSHELGHTLGLTFVPEDEGEPTEIFHNLEYGPYIMDPGSERPFEERAEINGAGPAVFNEQNYNYLRKYLPRNE